MNASLCPFVFAFSLLCGVITAPAFAQSTVAPTNAAAPAEKTVEINRAAKVALVEGEVTAISSAKQRRALKVADEINEGDSIVTGKDGELHLEMDDGGYISVRSNTKMRFTKFQAKGETTDGAIIGLLEGSFRSVTGWIGKFNRNNYTVRTSTATIGIRGTDHEPYVIPKGSSEGEAGTYDKVNEGGSYIQTPMGRADVGPNQSGFVPHDKTSSPRVLKEIPRHFRAGRNERLFAGKHAEVQSRIEKRREDRRGEIRKKLEQRKPDALSKREQRQQAIKEKREAAQKQKEEARKAREDAKKAKQAKREAKEEDEEKDGHAGKAARKAHPLRK